MVFCGFGYVVFWGVFVNYGCLYFEDVGFLLEIVVVVFVMMLFVLIFGWLIGVLGDWIVLLKLLFFVFFLEGVGVFVFLCVDM